MQKKIRDFILEYNRRFKSTILLTSHYMADVKKLCKRVIVINRGRIVYDGDFDNLISKYADFKTITIDFGSNRFEPKRLSELGRIKYISSGKIELIVPRATTKDIAAIILEKFPIEDLTIEEPEVEEIVRLVFSKKKK
jgi:ABC-2 type transport system ATP-binding protein